MMTVPVSCQTSVMSLSEVTVLAKKTCDVDSKDLDSVTDRAGTQILEI